MGWFTRTPYTPEPDDPPPKRLASDEFLSALAEVAEGYDRREAQARASVVKRAEELSRKTSFNYRELEEQYIQQLRSAILDAVLYRGLADEVRSTIRSYTDDGRTPPYMQIRSKDALMQVKVDA